MADQDRAQQGNEQDQARSGGRDKGARAGRPRYALYGLAGVGLLAVAGAGYYLYREKSVEKPRHKVLEVDGQFEVREYPELLIAESSVAGGRDFALDQGFSKLADYIFAKSRAGERVPMTAPVFSSGGGGDNWLTRFVMPAHFTRDTLPQPGAGVRIDTLPARKVAVMHFPGAADEAAFAEREAQLRSWIGAKKYETRGDVERAFYNSPFIPGPLRRTEVLIPIV
jgi:hypothetical protein